MNRTATRIASTLLAAVSLALAPSKASAQTDAAEGAARPMLTAGASAALVSGYVWRGFVLSDQVSVQPNVWVRVGDVTASSFMNTYRAASGSHSFNEHDLTVEYEHGLGNATLTAGWVNYFFRDPAVGRHSNEVYVRSSWAGPLAPSLLISQDVQQGSGTYLNAGLGHEWSVPRSRMSIATTVALGYNHHQWTDSSGLSDANVGTKVTWTPRGSAVALSPFINYSRSLNNEIAPSRMVGGIEVSVF